MCLCWNHFVGYLSGSKLTLKSASWFTRCCIKTIHCIAVPCSLSRLKVTQPNFQMQQLFFSRYHTLVPSAFLEKIFPMYNIMQAFIYHNILCGDNNRSWYDHVWSICKKKMYQVESKAAKDTVENVNFQLLNVMMWDI